MEMPRHSLVIALLLTLTSVVYRGVWSADFVYEDRNSTTFLAPDPLPIQPLRVRSLTRVSYRIDRAISGDHPIAYHLQNLGIHLVNGWLVIALAELLGLSFPVALLAGAIFLLHPMNSEAVYYISGRTELLSTCMVLLGCHALLRAWTAGAFLAFVAAVVAKESAVIALGLYAFLRYTQGYRLPMWRPRDLTLAAACLVPAVGITATVFQYEYIPAIYSPLSFWAYARLQATAVWEFLGAIVLPLPGFFSVDHDFEIVTVPWQTVALVALGVAVAMVLYRTLQRPSWVTYGLVWFALALVPRFLMRIPEVLNEHQLYLGMVGLSIALACTLASLMRSEPCVSAS